MNIDPYFSVWTEWSVLNNTVHRTGKSNSMSGRVFVDGRQFHFLGFNRRKNNTPEIPTMTVESVDINAYSTIITCSNEVVRLRVYFTSSLLIEDLCYTSHPVAYCKVSYESLGGAAHDVQVQFLANEELVPDAKGKALFLFAYDHIDSIQYFGDNLKAYWKTDGKTIEEVIQEAAGEYDSLLARCNAFSDKLQEDATRKGGEKYAEMLLSMCQIMAAHKLVVDKESNHLYISNGCAATVCL